MSRHCTLGVARQQLLRERPRLVDPPLRDHLNDRRLERPARLFTRLREPTRQRLHARVGASARANLVAQTRGLVELPACQRRLGEHDQDLGPRGAVQPGEVRARALRSAGAGSREPKRELHRRGRQRLAREVIADLERLPICREVIDQQHQERPRRCFCAPGQLEGLGQRLARDLIIVLRNRLETVLDQHFNTGQPLLLGSSSARNDRRGLLFWASHRRRELSCHVGAAPSALCRRGRAPSSTADVVRVTAPLTRGVNAVWLRSRQSWNRVRSPKRADGAAARIWVEDGRSPAPRSDESAANRRLHGAGSGDEVSMNPGGTERLPSLPVGSAMLAKCSYLRFHHTPSLVNKLR